MVGIWSRRAGIVGVIIAAVLFVAAAPATALPAFGTGQASLPGVGGVGPGRQVTITKIDVGKHNGFDRIVFVSRNGRPAVTVEYVNEVKQVGSGETVSLLGAAFLRVTLRNTAWQTSPSPQPTITPGFPALCQLKGAGEFEAVATYGIGQATKAGFRVFTIGSDRVAIDLSTGEALPTTSGFPTPQVIGFGLGLLLAGLAVYVVFRRRHVVWATG